MKVTHFQKYFASRWEIFYHSFMGMTANRTKTTSAIRCNGMSRKRWKNADYQIGIRLSFASKAQLFFDLLHFVACSDPFDFICKTRFMYAWEKRNFSLLLYQKTIEKIQHPSKSLEHRIVVYWKFEIPIEFGVVIGCYVQKIGAIKFQFDIQ